MAISAPTVVGSGTSTTNNTTVSLSVSTVPPRGALLLVGCRFNNSQTSISFSDGINNYTTRTAGSINEAFGDCIVTGDMTGATITATGAANSTAKIIIAAYVTGAQQENRFGAATGSVPVFQGTARNIGGNTLTTKETGDIQFGFWSLDTTETSLTASAGWTNVGTWTGSGYYTANSLSLEGVYQIITSVGAKQPLATGGASPFAYGAFTLWYRVAPPRHPAVNFQDPGWAFKALRPKWRRRNGILLPDYAI